MIDTWSPDGVVRNEAMKLKLLTVLSFAVDDTVIFKTLSKNSEELLSQNHQNCDIIILQFTDPRRSLSSPPRFPLLISAARLSQGTSGRGSSYRMIQILHFGWYLPVFRSADSYGVSSPALKRSLHSAVV